MQRQTCTRLGPATDRGGPDEKPVKQDCLSPRPSRHSCSVPAAIAQVIKGDDGPNTLIGTPQSDLIDGRGDNDTLKGLAGGDTLRGGPDDDLIVGGRGKDFLRGGPDDDLMRGGPKRDSYFGGKGDDSGGGGAGPDTVDGGPGRDQLKGGTGKDLLYGGFDTEHDVLNAGPGDDTCVVPDTGPKDKTVDCEHITSSVPDL